MDPLTLTDTELVEWLEEHWCLKLEQRVSCTMIFRKVLGIDPSFYSGLESDGHLDRMNKTLLYYGLVNCFELCDNKIAGADQKLHNNWD